MFFKKQNIDKRENTSTIINNLKYDKKLNRYNGEFFFKRLNKTCSISIENKELIPYAEKCIDYINNTMPEETYKEICDGLCRFCNYYTREYENFDIPKNLKGEEVFKYASIEEIAVTSSRENSIGFLIDLSCEWEIEHGCYIVVIDDKVTYVGDFDELYEAYNDLWYNFKKKWNFAYNEDEWEDY